eukprot:scaffold1933_cov165-Amphora_coffeaeformis.AAC.16
MTKRGRKRREVGVIKDIPIEPPPGRGAATEESCEAFGPILSSRSLTMKGKRQHQIVRYRQASFDTTRRELGMIGDIPVSPLPGRVVVREGSEAIGPLPS